MESLKTFREIIFEGLSYKVKEEEFEKILDNNKFVRMSKGGKKEKIKLFGDGKEVIFSYEDKTKRLIILKQGWQLMNIKRGY